MTFGEYFKKLRKSKQFTQEEIASKTGKSKMLVSGIEAGRNGAFIDEYLEIIAEAFALSSVEKVNCFMQHQKHEIAFPSIC